ncbi:RNA 2',3'-cyclic phosphodiesterase [Streptomyces sp. A7024]|uniref:RNA 2',3'-cyclic phosphodiesterase n=1 Tax=Streptomyces coryli TaxID=1128680 RepID=A0A6G4U6W0_9ACTN|nr:RNA 2',3'-cyclic phosphodiesterase [Streptomyces coryli]NGN67843.1 RNA 2',3'-cyclic phosphodiesterase [Streptomyces coryli]
MRLFAAVVPPGGVLGELAGVVAELRALPGSGELRWPVRASWHFTVAFYGEVDEERVSALWERLERAAARRDGFSLRIDGGGRFGDRVLWAGVAGERDALKRLAGSAAAAGRRVGLDMEERAYKPHLTLARQGRDGRVSLGPYADRLKRFHSAPWTVAELRLLRSHLPRAAHEQPRYETVAAWPLRASR